MSKDYSILDELVPKTQELHRAIFDKGYEQGFNDGKVDVVATPYGKGLRDGWEYARRILFDENLSSARMLDELGAESWYQVIKKCNVVEVISKIKEYEEKQKQADNEIKVSDEVVDGEVFNSGKGIVTFVSPVILYVLWYDGSTGRRKLTDVKKTGRTFPKIAEVLEKLKEAQDETK